MIDLSDDLPEIRAALESLGAEATVRRREVARIVQLVLDRLPNRYGDALEWKYIDGFSVAEIAERLALAPKAAESLLTRARTAFRDAFKAAYGRRLEWGGGESMNDTKTIRSRRSYVSRDAGRAWMPNGPRACAPRSRTSGARACVAGGGRVLQPRQPSPQPSEGCC
jgi:hypothetical protein